MNAPHSEVGETGLDAGPSWRRHPVVPGRSRRKRIALSLSGGGLTGAYYEIGCLAALDDFLGFDFSTSGFDIYIGVSAGATVAGLLAKGIPIRKIYWALLTNSDPSLHFKRGDMYDVNRWAILFAGINVGLSVPGYFLNCLRTRVRPSPFEFMHYVERIDTDARAAAQEHGHAGHDKR